MFKPVYKELIPLVENFIKECEDDRLPGIRVLAKKFEVNPATVSKVLKILEEKNLVTGIQGQGFFINRKNRRANSKTIAIINLIPVDYTEDDELARLKKPFNYSPHTQAQIRQIIDKEIMEDGYHAFSVTCNINAVNDNLAFFEKMPVDGFLFIYSSLSNEIADFLKKKQIPFVAANACYGISEVNFVDMNTAQAVNDFILKLQENGIRKITYFGPPGKYGYSERLRRIFMNALGSQFREFCFIDGTRDPLCFDWNPSLALAKRGLDAMMRDGTPPEVILCGADFVEFMKKAIEEKGLRFPEDIGLATISIDPDIKDITVLNGDESEIFGIAAKRLISMIKSEDHSVIQQWLPMKIIWNEKSIVFKKGFQ